MSESLSTTLYPAGEGEPSSRLIIADLNGDGRLDVIVPQTLSVPNANPDVYPYVSPDQRYDVLLNDGSGQLLPPVAHDLGIASLATGSTAILGVADVTGDSVPDLLLDHASYLSGGAVLQQVQVAPGDGTGGFGTAVTTATLPSGFTPDLLADVTGDALPDLVGTSNGSLAVAAGEAGGAFGPVQSYGALLGTPVAVLPTATPGVTDLLTFQSSFGFPGGTLTVFDDANGTSVVPVQSFVTSDNDGLTVADLNGDGLPDLVLDGRSTYDGPSTQFLSVFLNDGSGGLDRQASVSLPAGTLVSTALAVADVTGDGRADAVLDVSGGFVVLPGNGDGSFGPGTFSAALPETTYLQAADLAGDGTADLLTVLQPAAAGDGLVLAVESFATPETACFATGTRILTARGEVPVEALRVGDAVMALLGQELATVRWIGHRRLRPRAHPRPDLVQPVRILAGAFGPGRPRADLRVSPGHALLVDGALVPAELLVNGASIVQEDVDAVTYWHVELDRHDVLLAEGLPAESFLDVGNRGAFENGGAVRTLHPDFAATDAAACAPALRGGAALTAIRARLLRHARETMGFATTDDPGLVLLADGRPVAPSAASATRARFEVPRGARTLRLRSRRWVPRQMLPEADDARSLGVCVRRLWADGVLAALPDLAAGAGWHPPEADPGQGAWCWTDGEAELPRAATIEVELGGMLLAWAHAAEELYQRA